MTINYNCVIIVIKPQLATAAVDSIVIIIIVVVSHSGSNSCIFFDLIIMYRLKFFDLFNQIRLLIVELLVLGTVRMEARQELYQLFLIAEQYVQDGFRFVRIRDKYLSNSRKKKPSLAFSALQMWIVSLSRYNCKNRGGGKGRTRSYIAAPSNLEIGETLARNRYQRKSV